MKDAILIIFLTVMALNLAGCSGGDTSSPPSDPNMPDVEAGDGSYITTQIGKLSQPIDELSGICMASNGLFYAIQDSGQASAVSVFGRDGKVLGQIKMSGANNVDFEAVACHGTTVTVGDIGDNEQERDDAALYTFTAPASHGATVAATKTLVRFEDGRPRNAEGLSYGPDGRLYLVTKAFDRAVQGVYEIKAGVAKPMVTLRGFNPIGDMSISPKGDRFLLAMDEDNKFYDCDWTGVCELIQVSHKGDHEAVTHTGDKSFVFMSESEKEIYETKWAVKAPGPKPAPGIPPVVGPWWKPGPVSDFQIFHYESLADLKKKLRAVPVVTLELEDLVRFQGKEAVAYAHSLGTKVSCYVSFSHADYHHNAKLFPADAKLKTMADWGQEKWGDLRRPSMKVYMAKLFDECASYGADAVEPDNADLYGNADEAGIKGKITLQENIDALKDYARIAHEKGLAIMLKNSGEMVNALAEDFDGVYVESCRKYDECSIYDKFRALKKTVVMLEYSKSCSLISGAACKKTSGYFKAF